MDALDNIFTRRSIRGFDSRPISHDDLETLAKAAIFAPNGMNRQLWHFTVVTGQKEIQNLARAIAKQLGRDEGYNFYGPTAIIIASEERDNPHGAENCACALQNVFLAAHALGIGSVWINQLKGISDKPAIRPILDRLGMPKNHIAYGIAALGYAAQPPREPDKNTAAISFFEGE